MTSIAMTMALLAAGTAAFGQGPAADAYESLRTEVAEKAAEQKAFAATETVVLETPVGAYLYRAEFRRVPLTALPPSQTFSETCDSDDDGNSDCRRETRGYSVDYYIEFPPVGTVQAVLTDGAGKAVGPRMIPVPAVIGNAQGVPNFKEAFLLTTAGVQTNVPDERGCYVSAQLVLNTPVRKVDGRYALALTPVQALSAVRVQWSAWGANCPWAGHGTAVPAVK